MVWLLSTSCVQPVRNIASESVWNDGTTEFGTEGGIGTISPPPIYRQRLALSPSLNPGAGMERGVPHVSGYADPVSGYQIRVDGVEHGGVRAQLPRCGLGSSL